MNPSMKEWLRFTKVLDSSKVNERGRVCLWVNSFTYCQYRRKSENNEICSREWPNNVGILPEAKSINSSTIGASSADKLAELVRGECWFAASEDFPIALQSSGRCC